SAGTPRRGTRESRRRSRRAWRILWPSIRTSPRRGAGPRACSARSPSRSPRSGRGGSVFRSPRTSPSRFPRRRARALRLVTRLPQYSGATCCAQRDCFAARWPRDSMSVRTVGASPLYRIPRLAYHWMGAATAPLRLHPAFIMIGAQRCGTTSLFRALVAHPQVMSPAFRKGINYFDLNYFRGERWYTGHFPISEIARRHASSYGEPMAFEASGYYMYHPFALERMARDLPRVKLVAMLRDPAERAFSPYKHE